MSNLLQKASIITTPTAYNTGKILSVKPVQTYGPELVTNGDFATDSDWTKGTGWSIGEGKAVATSSFNNLAQSGYSFVAGNSYKVTYEVLDYVNGNIIFQLTGGTTLNGDTRNTNGTFTQYVIATDNHTTFRFRGTNFTGSIDNVSVKEALNADFDFQRNSSATRVGSNGLIQDVASNLPRIDYTGGVGSWKFEPQRTNLVTYSEDFSQIFVVNSTVLINNNISPDGTINGNLWLANATTDEKELDELYSVTSGTTYTESWFVKYKSLQFIQMVTTSATFGAKYANFDLINGTLGNGNFTDFSIKSYSNGWYRISATQAATNTGSGRLGGLRMIASATAPRGGNVTTVGTESVETWGHQLEVGSYPTSYIRSNSGSATTRLADVANNAGSSDLINSTEGVLYAEISALANDSYRFISLSDGTNNNNVRLNLSPIANQISFEANSGGSLQLGYTNNNTNILLNTKICINFKLNDFSVWINGIKVHTDTNGIAPIGLNILNFDRGTGTNLFYGNTKSVAVFKEALTDLELECLVSWMSFSDMGIALGYTVE